MNKVFLIGNLTRDPELKNTANSIPVCNFTLAIGRRFNQNETDYIPIIVWRTQAENCAKYLKKGSKCAVSGAIQTRSYDAQDGTKRYVTEVVADEVQFLASRSGGSDNTDESYGKSNAVDTLTAVEDESLPF